MHENEDDLKVIKALENDKYKWRTVGGISKETGLSPELIRGAIRRRSDEIVQSSVPSKAGDELFTTRRKHKKNRSAFDVISAVLRNRAD